MFEQIVYLASAIVRPTEEERPLLTAMCTAAMAELAGRLRKGLAPEDCGDAFPCAAALLAAARMLPCRGGGDVEQFSVGDVSVRTGGGSGINETAAAMRRQADSMLTAYCGDGEFAFLGVKG